MTAAIIIAVLVIFAGVVARLLSSGSDYDDRMNDIVNGRHKYPKK